MKVLFEECLDVIRFARERLGFEPDEQQAMVLNPGIHRGILNCSRQWGKSTVTALKAVHHAWHFPQSNVLIVSPTERQSGEFIEKARAFVRELGEKPRGDGHNTISIRLANGSRIVGLPGERAKVRGFSKVSLMLVDEAAEVADSAYLSVRPMLAMGGRDGGKLWLMSTPEGRRGFFYRAWMDPDGGWFKLSVPATENPRISKEFLERERRDMGERWFQQEYMCQFLNVLDGYFEEEVVRGCVRPEIPALW